MRAFGDQSFETRARMRDFIRPRDTESIETVFARVSLQRRV
jgi:hypothetical protein